MLNSRSKAVLVVLACALPAPSLLVALDRSAAYANEPSLFGGERRSIEGKRRQVAELLRAGDFRTAASISREILSRQPLDRTALRQLALAESELGHREQAGSVLVAASFVSWRDPYTEKYMFDLTFDMDRLDDAAQRADAISRTNRGHGAGFRALNELLARGGGPAAVAKRLATLPPWRPDYFRDARDGLPAAPERTLALLRAMAATRAPASDTEVDRALAALVQRGYAADAWAFWRSAHGARGGALIDDPDFRVVQVGQPGQVRSPFVWSTPADTPVRVVGHRDADGRRALQVAAREDRSVLFVSRRLVIAPGRYRVAYQASGPADQLDRLHPDLRCSADVALRLEPVGEADERALTAVVPAGCRVLQFGFTIEPGASAGSAELAIRGVSFTRQ